MRTLRTHLFLRRAEADEAREDNLKERTYAYVTEGCHSATKHPDGYKTKTLRSIYVFYFLG